MEHYNPCDLDEAKETVKQYQKEGLKATLTIVQYYIVRETSKYNKYIKWFLRTFQEDGSLLSSQGFRTRKQASENVTKPRKPLPIGNSFNVMYYKEKEV